jgi:hypothetical protein
MITPAMRHAWDRARHYNGPPHHRRLPLDYAAWQAWQTSQGSCGATATTRLMQLPVEARDAYLVLVGAFMAGDPSLPPGPALPAWARM